MYVKTITFDGFRGLNTTVQLATPLGLVIGENNAGKTAVIDGLRLVLATGDSADPQRLYVRPTDFAFGEDGEYIEPRTFTIDVDLCDLTPTQRGRLITCLTPSNGSNTARISIHATWDGTESPVVYHTGGEVENREIEFFAREAIKCIYLPPLRDATRDLRPGTSNRLRQLVNSYAPANSQHRKDLVDLMKAANEDLSRIGAITNANSAILKNLAGLTGSQAYVQRAELKFSDPTYDRVVGNLRALMGRTSPMELETNGLGFTNLLYMAVLLSSLRELDETSLCVLLIEEPEAHLHPQLQELLMKHLEIESRSQVQVVASTHSAQFASSARVERITVMCMSSDGHRGSVCLERLQLEPQKLSFLARFLDVTKSALLFAKGVILVEGIAEQLLISTFAEHLNSPLEQRGVLVVNVGGLNFASFAALFGGSEGLPVNCAIVTDGDTRERKRKSKDPITGEEQEETYVSESPFALKASGELENDRVRVFKNAHTFEVSLAEGSDVKQKEILVKALTPVRPRLAGQLSRESLSEEQWKNTFYGAVAEFKGDFAQSLASVLATDSSGFSVPSYLEDAIAWACGSLQDKEDEEYA